MEEECFVNPERGPGETEVSGPVLFCINPGEAMVLGRYAKAEGWQRQFLYNSTCWLAPGGGAALCGPALGAPMAVMTLEKMIALGGRRFVVFGSCGALSPELAVGDVLLPTWAVSQEGTSNHYPLVQAPLASPQVHGVLAELLGRHGVKTLAGGVWTTDAPYRERRQDVRRYRAQGVLAVEMEFSALIAVAAFRQVELAAVMVVSDLLSGPAWQPGFHARPFKSMIARIGRTLFDELASGRL